jgi:hypothetical protein
MELQDIQLLEEDEVTTQSFLKYPCVYQYYDWLKAFEPYFSSPVYLSFLESCVKTFPFFTERFRIIEDEARLESIKKEYEASVAPCTKEALDYTCWFGNDPDDVYVPLHPIIGSRPYAARRIRKHLQVFLSKIEDKEIFPKVTRKHASFATSQDFTEISGSTIRPNAIDLERYYQLEGIIPPGNGVEMKQSWFFGDLKPRTYYAYSGRSYELSRYLQVVFNQLVDAFPISNRFKRANLSRLKLTRNHLLLIYDYTSFTSSLEQQAHFIEALADFTDSHRVSVKIYNSALGFCDAELGPLLREYNEVNAHFPCEFGTLAGQLIYHERFQHSKAGYLGVHGNLASCTAIHGMVMLMITGRDDLGSCFGDDGLLGVYIGPEQEALDEGEGVVEEVINFLRLLGELSLEKTARLKGQTQDNEYWTYVKRPLCYALGEDQERYIVLASHYSFPIPTLLMGDIREVNSGRERPGWGTTFEKLNAYLNQLSALRLQLSRLYVLDDAAEFLVEYFQDVYKLLHLPLSGDWQLNTQVLGNPYRLPGERHRSDFEVLVAPPLPRYEARRNERWSNTVLPCPDTTLDLLQTPEEISRCMPILERPLSAPKVSSDPKFIFDLEESSYETTFEGFMTGHLSMLRHLGFVHASAVSELLIDNDSLWSAFVRVRSRNRDRRVYRFYIQRNTPGLTLGVSHYR